MTTKAYNRFVEEVSDRLYGFVLKHCRRKDLAQDIVQEAFETLWQKKSEVDSETAKAWLFKVAYHRWIDIQRKQKREQVLTEGEPPSTRRDEQRFLAKDAADRMLSELTETQKTLVLLREYEGYSYRDIADITALSLSQVKVYLYRARKRLNEISRALNQKES